MLKKTSWDNKQAQKLGSTKPQEFQLSEEMSFEVSFLLIRFIRKKNTFKIW